MMETIPLVARVSTTEVFHDPQLGQGASLIVHSPTVQVHLECPSKHKAILPMLGCVHQCHSFFFTNPVRHLCDGFLDATCARLNSVHFEHSK